MRMLMMSVCVAMIGGAGAASASEWQLETPKGKECYLKNHAEIQEAGSEWGHPWFGPGPYGEKWRKYLQMTQSASKVRSGDLAGCDEWKWCRSEYMPIKTAAKLAEEKFGEIGPSDERLKAADEAADEIIDKILYPHCDKNRPADWTALDEALGLF